MIDTIGNFFSNSQVSSYCVFLRSHRIYTFPSFTLNNCITGFYRVFSRSNKKIKTETYTLSISRYIVEVNGYIFKSWRYSRTFVENAASGNTYEGGIREYLDVGNL